jgi:hypothetical protein
MSNKVSFRHSVAKGLRETFNLSGITYDATNPQKDVRKAVSLTTQGNYGPVVTLAGAGARVIGSIILVEPTDGASVKGAIDVATGGAVVWFKYTGTAPAPGDAIVGAAGTGDDTGDGYVTSAPALGETYADDDPALAGRGIVVEVDTVNREVGVIF